MTFHILTIFPKIFNSYINEGIIKRAQKKGIINIKIYDLRDWAVDKHKTVDDRPFGGGAGMIMKADVLYEAIRDIKLKISSKGGFASGGKIKKLKIILFSAKGKTWNQTMAKKYSKFGSVLMICGRYEGVDERVKKFVDEEISIGDYVLTGGEIPAMVIVDSITRLLPHSLGNAVSALDESHNIPSQLEYPQYTRPEILIVGNKKYRVPKILLTGHHKKITDWRQAKMKR